MKKLTLIAVISIIVIGIYTCSKSDESSSGILSKETVSAKWVVSGTGLGYTSFEFNKSGNYIVVQGDGTKSTTSQIILFGTYQITDNQTIVLSDLGTLKLTSINGTSFTFTFTPGGSGTPITISTNKAAIIATSAKTDLLCRTWELVSLNGRNVAGTEDELTVLFSNAGTYFVSWKYLDDGGLAQWTWKDNSQTSLCYSWEGNPSCDGLNEVVIKELSSSSLTADEYGEIYILKPATVTKSVQTRAEGLFRTANNKTGLFKHRLK